MQDGPARWADACQAAAIFAVAPHAVGGLWVIARASPIRDMFLDHLTALIGETARIAPGAPIERLTGGLDLAATLAAGRPVRTAGLLDRDVTLILPMAERIEAGPAALIGQGIDAGVTTAIALDERAEPEEALPPALADRLGLVVMLDGLGQADCLHPLPSHEEIGEARQRLEATSFTDNSRETLCATVAGFGCGLRASLQADACARASAALRDADEVAEEDLATALRLVVAPRATQLPTPSEEEPTPPENEPPETPDDAPKEEREQQATLPDDLMIEAAKAAMPETLLTALMAGETQRAAGRGGKGAERKQSLRGRPAGVRPGKPGGGRRLDIGATLRTAAPWQKLRERVPGGPIAIRADDFRITRYRERAETLTIFAVDASGSAALARLAEAKGAVELMLAEAYRRRDHVAVIGFRGTGAELLLPPTRALARAKRALAGLPGGGGTPLAAGLSEAMTLAQTAQRRGQSVALIVLTDGRANIPLEPDGPRSAAQTDARQVATAIRAAGLSALFVDTSRRPRGEAEEIATAMGARYFPMPQSDPAAIGRMVREG